MTVLTVIPARAGSRGVPGKNLAPVAGRSLVARAIDSARAVPSITDVAVSSDGDEILEAAVAAGAVPLRRPGDLAGDLASSESALQHALDQWEAEGRISPEVLVFVQCTSPFIDPEALGRAVDRVVAGDADVVFSAAPFHGFVWRFDANGQLRGANHDERVRLRRQDREPEYLETGAFYVMRVDGFRRHAHRFFGRVHPEVVDPRWAIEVDDPGDLALARLMATSAAADSVWPVIDDIDAVVTDFDGVHTDNRAIVDEHGIESVRIDRSDGMGIAMLRESGVRMLILSKERNPVVEQRAAKVAVECIAGCDDKLAVLRSWAEANGLSAERIMYVGNDVNDLECLDWVGWPVVVLDAHPGVMTSARCVTTRPGGRGAVREVIDQLLRTQRTTKNEEI